MGLFDGWGSPSWGSQGMMGGGGNGFGGQSGSQWTPVQGQPGVYQNGNMYSTGMQNPIFPDMGGQSAQPLFPSFGMMGQSQQPAVQGPANQSGQTTQPAQSPMVSGGYAYSPFSAMGGNDYAMRGQQQGPQGQGPMNNSYGPSNPFSTLGRYGW